ncbi:hypothetical protein SELMODRAFT_110559 [Selaginella moellendorffii]|uniref:Pentacotripeptide-repeat region of PRORP domain-containing protein n=1 Tax=Selaginella moellendorffii TaxID=88036 RepID=D8S7C0_SELML|nr:hypothetical protein SELMODRAFT_110559 [Selaginella moellendorffii]
MRHRNSISWNTLLVSYAQNGHTNTAKAFFSTLPEQNLVSWNVVIGMYALNGQTAQSLELFRNCVADGVNLDDVSFTSALIALSHSGEVDDSLFLFKSMIADYLVTPGKQQYGCIISLFARGGYDRSCKELIDTMPFFPDTHDWTCLASANRIYKSNSLGMGHHNTRKQNAN